MPIIKPGGPQKFSHLKYWAAELPTLRTTALQSMIFFLIIKPFLFSWTITEENKYSNCWFTNYLISCNVIPYVTKT